MRGVIDDYKTMQIIASRWTIRSGYACALASRQVSMLTLSDNEARGNFEG